MTDFLALILHSGWTFFGSLIIQPVLALCFASVVQDASRGIAIIIHAIRGQR